MKTRFILFLIILLAAIGMAQAQPVSYLWSNGATTPEIVVNPSQTTTYYVTITQNGKQYYDSLVVQVDSAAGLFAQDTVRGCGPLLSLFAPEGQWQSLAWSSGESGNSIQVSASGWYYLDATDTSGCTTRDSVFVSLFQVDLGEDKVICAGQSVTLNASTLGGSSGSASGLPPNLQQGLVGYWPFNGDANDESGNGNHGIVNGATLTADRFGNAGRAYNFDGINDLIEVAHSPSLSPALVSISLWVNPAGYYLNGEDDANYLVGKGPDFNQGHYSLHFKTISRKVRPSLGLGSSGLFVNSISDITTDRWRHLLSTWDGNELKIYIDGVLESSVTNSEFILGVNSDNLFFGSMAANSTWPYWMNGKIDDIAIYNRALSASEIQQLYNASTYAWSTGETTPSINVTPTQTTTYYCTVTNGNQSCTDSVTVTVNQTPETPSITAGGPTSFCDGSSVTLSAPAGLAYLWSNGSTNQSITVNSAGSYTVQTISGSCSSAVSEPVQVTVSPGLETPLISAGGPTTFCSGGLFSLSAPAGFSYLWSNGSTNQSITVNSAGSYTVQTISGSCSSAVSEPVQVTVNQAPETPTITASGATSFCQGGSVTLSAPAGLAYLWSNGQTDQSISIDSTGSYTVQTISNGCTSAVSQATQVTLLPNPASEFTYILMGAEVQLNYQNASASPDSLRWDFGDGQTSSETSPIHLYEGSGIFSICLKTFLDGCSSQTCKPVQITVTGIKPESGIAVSVIPNPSRGIYELSIDNLRGTAKLEVLDALGKQVYEGEVSSQGLKTRQELDIRHVAMGVYTLRLQTSDGPKFLRLKKE